MCERSKLLNFILGSRVKLRVCSARNPKHESLTTVRVGQRYFPLTLPAVVLNPLGRRHVDNEQIKWN